MTMGNSHIVKRIILDAHEQGRNFRVIVADSRPRHEGKQLLRKLVKHGVRCSYVLLNACSYVMKEVTKVLLGAHAVFSNGYVMSRVGCAMVAMLAKDANVPVLVCCETYKFSDRVQTDSFVFNELGDPDDLISLDHDTRAMGGASVGGTNTRLDDWRDQPTLKLLNLVYDVTPPSLIDVIVTEVGLLPTTSVPVVLREYMSHLPNM